MAEKQARCTAQGCNRPVPRGRRKYCSSKCQLREARIKTREWRERRIREELEEQRLNIPRRTRRYRIRNSSEIWSYMHDPDLVSFRNPQGSTYVEELIKEIDTRWPGDNAEDYDDDE